MPVIKADGLRLENPSQCSSRPRSRAAQSRGDRWWHHIADQPGMEGLFGRPVARRARNALKAGSCRPVPRRGLPSPVRRMGQQ